MGDNHQSQIHQSQLHQQISQQQMQQQSQMQMTGQLQIQMMQQSHLQMSNNPNNVRGLGMGQVQMQPQQVVQRSQLNRMGSNIGQPMQSFAAGPNRLVSTQSMPQHVRVISQGMFQQQQQPTFLQSTPDEHPGMQQQANYVKASNVPISGMPVTFLDPNGGAQQPMYNAMRIGNQPQPITSSTGSPIRFVSNTGIAGSQMLRLVSQQPNPQQQQQQQQQHYFPSEVQQQQQPQLVHRMPAQPRQMQPQRQLPMQVQEPGQMVGTSIGMQQGFVGGGTQPQLVTVVQQQQQQLPPQQQQQMAVQGRSQTPDAANLLATMQSMAQRYLPSVKHAIESIRPLPEFENVLSKYNSIRNILENPRQNLQNMQGKMAPLENLLQNICKDPLFLLNQARNSEEGKAKAAAAQRMDAAQQQQPRLRLNNMPSSSSLNSLLSQPVGSPGGGHSSIRPPLIGTHGMQMGGNPHSPSTTMPPFNSSQVRVEAPANIGMEPAKLPPSDFWDSLREIRDEFKALADSGAHDPKFATRLVRAINEISEDTRQMRESTGHLLPSDIFPNSTLPLCSKSWAVASVKEKGLVSKISPKYPTEEEQKTPLSRKRARDDSADADGLEVTLEESAKRMKEEEEVETADKNSQLSEIDANRLEVTKPAIALFSPAKTSDCKSGDAVIGGIIKPVMDLDRLNPDVLAEVHRVEARLGVTVEANQDPPCVEDMETYFTCRNEAEWKSSFHLAISFDDNLMPCRIPVLYVRLPPDYVTCQHVNWYLNKTEFEKAKLTASERDQTGDAGAISFFSVDEKDAFLMCVLDEVTRALDMLRSNNHGKISLSALAKTWLTGIFIAAARFMNTNILL